MARSAAAAPSAAEQNALILALTPEKIRRVLTLIIAYKANWWQTNHHTGTIRESASGYVAKVLNAVFGQNTQAYVTLAHTISHWCSTTLILKKADHIYALALHQQSRITPTSRTVQMLSS